MGQHRCVHHKLENKEEYFYKVAHKLIYVADTALNTGVILKTHYFPCYKKEKLHVVYSFLFFFIHLFNKYL